METGNNNERHIFRILFALPFFRKKDLQGNFCSRKRSGAIKRYPKTISPLYSKCTNY